MVRAAQYASRPSRSWSVLADHPAPELGALRRQLARPVLMAAGESLPCPAFIDARANARLRDLRLEPKAGVAPELLAM